VHTRQNEKGESWMRKVVFFLVLAISLTVLTSCSMENKFPHGQQVKPDNVEEKK